MVTSRMDPDASAGPNVLTDPARLAALEKTGLLDSVPEESFDHITWLATRLLEAPAAVISLVTGDRQFFKSAVGVREPWAALRGTPLSHSICKHVVVSGAPVVIGDARRDALVRDSPALDDLGIVAFLGVPLTAPGGHVLGGVCVIDSAPRVWTDEQLDALCRLAEMARAEIELRVARADAERANRSRTEFYTRVTHELRTPLTAIIGFSRTLLRRGTLGEAERDYASRIEANGRQLLALIDDLLDLSRAESGRVVAERVPTDVGALVREALLAVEVNRRADVELRCLEPAEPLRIHTDPVKLQRIVTNLVGNALKFTERGYVEVSSGVQNGSSPPRVVIEVRDTGIGIPADRLHTIFDAYAQATRDTSRAFGGTGLGQAIARELAELLGGTLSAESEEGAGATFRLELPHA